jgi:hypothetical protein
MTVGKHEPIMIDATHLKAHRMAASQNERELRQRCGDEAVISRAKIGSQEEPKRLQMLYPRRGECRPRHHVK